MAVASVNATPGSQYTYSCALNDITVATLPTDVWTIFGSATKTIKILSMTITGTQTTAGSLSVLIIKRSTANTGGTSSAPAIVPNDSANPAVTATVLSYTANPTLGNALGRVHAIKLFIPAVASVASNLPVVFDFKSTISQPVTLRGTAEGLCFNLNGTTVAGNVFNFSVSWTEE